MRAPPPEEDIQDDALAPIVPPEVPRADDGEVPPADRLVEAPPADGSVVVDGVRLNEDSPLSALREACKALNLSKNGAKKTCLNRLRRYVEHQSIVASHAAESTLRAEGQRQPVQQKRPITPTQEQVAAHSLTHEPYEDWCELCVQHRARQDKHAISDGSRTECSTICFDFGFFARSSEDDAGKLTVLCCHDKWSGLIGAIPAPGKGGKWFRHLVTELARLVVSTGHREVGLRCDSEPTTLSILEACAKTCRALGIKINAEPTKVGDHQANGGAERVVELVRSHAGILMSQVEKECNLNQQVFGAMHPLYSWAVSHAAWVHNRFKVVSGQTAFEKTSGRMYTGKLCQFGERALSFLRPSRKGDPKWIPGIWLGKTVSNDGHIVACKDVLYVTRSVRRLPSGFDSKLLQEISVHTWDHGVASLGHRLVLWARCCCYWASS